MTWGFVLFSKLDLLANALLLVRSWRDCVFHPTTFPAPSCSASFSFWPLPCRAACSNPLCVPYRSRKLDRSGEGRSHRFLGRQGASLTFAFRDSIFAITGEDVMIGFDTFEENRLHVPVAAMMRHLEYIDLHVAVFRQQAQRAPVLA